ncbi:MAG: PH domain-containing protein [Polaribacter sp.]|nr:PH domain-containing protein [Polaribacter sp.]
MFKNQQIEQLPAIEELTFKGIQKAYLKVIFIHLLLFFLVAFAGLFLLIRYKLQEDVLAYESYLYLGVLSVFFFVLLILIVGFSKRKYALREKDISYKSGIFLKKITTVPFSRIQHVEVDERPVSRIFKLASISVFTAGDSSDDLEIKGIKKTEALQIKEFISQQINE